MPADEVGPARAAETATPRFGRRLIDWYLGPGRLPPLTITHCIHSIAEAFFVVSMAGSIFFSVSPDAARPRVLLFLVVTLAPFLVMAPVVGPVIDRLRGGLVVTALATFAVRAALALLLAEHLRDLLMFPIAFGLLVMAKTYTVSRNALVPSIVERDEDLVVANARLAQSATIAGALGAAVAFGLYSWLGAVWTLRIGAIVYVVGAGAAFRLRALGARPEPVDPHGMAELVRPDVSSAVQDMYALSAAMGFSLFQFGFSLRAGGEPAWVLGAVLVGNAAGSFTGTAVAPWLRRRLVERSMFTAALLAPAVAAIAAGLVYNRATLVVAITVLGAALSVARRAFDSTIQSLAPHARRGQVYAGLETRAQLAWVAGACVAVALRVASWVGVLALAGFLAVVTLVHVRRRSGLGVLRPVAAAPLQERLLMRAESLAEHGFYDEAIVLAQLAEHAGRIELEADRPDGASLADLARSAIARARERIDR